MDVRIERIVRDLKGSWKREHEYIGMGLQFESL